MKEKSWALALVLLLGFYGCGSDLPTEPDPPPPEAGWLSAELTTPNDDDGGIIFTLSGVAIDSVESVVEGFFAQSVSNDVREVLITGEVTSGTIARIRVPDLEAAEEQLQGTVQQAAARETYEQRDVADYTLEFVPE